MKQIKTLAIGLAPAALALAISATPASAQVKPADEADLQCLAAMTFVLGVLSENEPSTSGDLENVAAIAAAASYYLGRLEGRTPTENWGRRLMVYANSHSIEELEPHIERCGNEFGDRAGALSSNGAAATGS